MGWRIPLCMYIYTIIMKISECYTLKNNKRRWRHQHWICYRAAMNQGNETLHTENGIIFVYPFVGAFVMKCVRMPDSQSQYRPVNQMLPTKLEKWFASLLPQCFMMRNTVIFVATWVNIVAGRQWCNHSIFTHKTTSYERSLTACTLYSYLYSVFLFKMWWIVAFQRRRRILWHIRSLVKGEIYL